MGSFYYEKYFKNSMCYNWNNYRSWFCLWARSIYILFSHGIKGLIGIIISSVIIGLIIYKSLKIIKYENIQNYDEFLKN